MLNALILRAEDDTVEHEIARDDRVLAAMQQLSRATENEEKHVPLRDPDADDALRQLEAHDLHRKSSRPLVSVLVGSTGRAIHIWRRWRAAVVILREPSLSLLCTQLVQQLCMREHLVDTALACIAPSLKVSPDALSDRLTNITAHELELLYARVHLDPAVDPRDAFVVALLNAARAGRRLDPQRLLNDLARTPICIETRPLAFLAALQELLAPEDLPAVLAVPGVFSRGEATADLDRWARFLTQVAGELPQLPLGLAVSETTHASYCRDASESFHKAVLQDSVIRLPIPDADSVKRVIETRLGPLPAELLSIAEELSQIGVGEETLEAFARVATETCRTPETEEAATAARSAAEAFLFDLLEHLPETSGLFALNLVESFHFGARPAEIDLASRELRIAIEVDGHYHFTDASRYRRDRQKDFLLQRHGYLVLRFLAEDVVREMFHVRDVILEAVRLRVISQGRANGRENA